LIKISNPAGDLPAIGLDCSKIIGTGVGCAVFTQQNGSSISGFFNLFIPDSQDKTKFVESPPVPYNATSTQVLTALSHLDPVFKDCRVTRSVGTALGTYFWSITFPYAAGDPPLIMVDAAALNGNLAHASIVELKRGRVPSMTASFNGRIICSFRILLFVI